MQLYSVDALSATSAALNQEADNDGTVFTHEKQANGDSSAYWTKKWRFWEKLGDNFMPETKNQTDLGAERVDASKLHHN